MNRKILIAGIILIVLVCIGAFVLSGSNSLTANSSINVDASSLKDMGNLVVNNSDKSYDNGLFHVSESDLNSILVTNNGKLSLKNSIINKTGDTQSTGDDVDFYGINSGVLVNTNGSLDISNVEIITDSKGSNGIFVTNSEASSSDSDGNPGETGGSQPPEATGSQPSDAGEGQSPGAGGGQPGSDSSSASGNTEATVSNVKITTFKDKSRGLDATYNGKITANNVEINTNGGSCAALATDRGEGEVHVENSVINTGVDQQSGRGSPLIYSTGNITTTNTQGTAFVSQIACIEGKNSIDIENCDFTGYGEGNREDNGEYVDLGGVFIYQSMSGDADVGTSLFNAVNSKLSISKESSYYSKAPMFHVTNTACEINLENTELSFGSGVFLDNSGQNQWGNEGSNGGDVKLSTENENIDGDVIVDEISSLNWTMKNTNFNGAINSTGNTTVSVGDSSVWTLTGDSTVSSLKVNGEINYNGHTLTVNGVKYTESNPFKG